MSAAIIPVIPVSFSFRCLQQTQVTWTLTSLTGGPITGANVTATLYVNRSRANPAAIPGTVADPNFENLPLTETPAGSGIYIGVVPQAFNPLADPAVVANGFVVVISAYTGPTLLDTWDIPAVIVPAQNVNDLVQLDDVKTWLGIALANTDSDGVLQLLISSFSQYVLNRTGISSFTQINQYTEIYDGNGSFRLALRNYPIQSIISIIVGSYTVPQSTGLTTPGWFIEQSQKSIAIRYGGNSYWGGSYVTSPYSIFPQNFAHGVGNVQVIYTAGYNAVPYDLYDTAMQVCSINYVRKDFKDLASKSMSVAGGTGTTTYRSFARPPGMEEVLRFYERRSLV